MSLRGTSRPPEQPGVWAVTGERVEYEPCGHRQGRCPWVDDTRTFDRHEYQAAREESHRLGYEQGYAEGRVAALLDPHRDNALGTKV